MHQVIKDKAPKPAGLVPKNIQAFIIVGLALLMILIMAITGHKHPTLTSVMTDPGMPNLIPVNAEKVTDFQKDIEQTQRESAPEVEAALLQQQKQLESKTRPAQPFPSNPYGIPVTAPDASGNYPPGAYATTLPPGTENPPSDPIKEEEKKRTYLSFFSDNVALTYRKDSQLDGSGAESKQSSTTARSSSQLQDPLEKQASAELARKGQLFADARKAEMISQLHTAEAPTVSSNPLTQVPPSSMKSTPSREIQRPESAAPRAGKNYVLFEGTILEALLINRLDGSFAGPVSCLVSNDIFSHDRQHLLIPAGSKILGEASKVDSVGQSRLAVAFHRLIMPDGYAVNLDQFKGLDQQGVTALEDKVNNHYVRIFGASIAIGALGGVAQLGTGSVLDSDSTDRIREGFGVSMANAGEHILDRFLNTLPTVTIREGSRIMIYLSNDLLLPDYTTHTLPTNL